MRILHLLLFALAVAAQALAAGPAEAAGKAQPAQGEDPLGPAMQFVIVRSNVAGCEPNCPQWISAEGAITRQSPALFKKFLKQVGKKRLPVLITSAGGDLDAAMILGDLIRARGLDVGIGWTYFDGCWPDDKSCKLAQQSKGVYRGFPVTWRAYCVSACPFVLAGGRIRLAGGATLGMTEFSMTVSSQRVFYEERYRMVKGKKKVVSRTVVKRGPLKTYTTSKLDKPTTRRLQAYARKMGLGKGFMALLGKPQSGSIYYLTGKEALSARLVTNNDNARSLVDTQLCQTTPAAENCVRRVATVERKLRSP